MELLERQRRELDESRSREEALHARVAELEGALERSRLDERFLRVSHRLASSPDSIIEARRLISGLIRNIDKAINDLKEE